MQKSLIYILIILVVGSFLSLTLRMNKLDRKLTCIHTEITALPVLLSPELRANQDALQKQMDLVASACYKGYIFSGESFVPK
ncbi:MAG: hypothetical protein A2991_04305 [Candidatus Terrybacteria bacterium RIFCSPLOWO2_01_FULL_58_14]|uniref:Uncharacterized protein n=2 Tax=Candidatus Terryibacteriota TaxID=1817920 RepID=A0A1G2PW11_9BACT|nr:MAG: hypothetical protein A2682_03455 [Candidatus Terrybacteria bacterium RIFCSPHIGHO2_01_FULL_58_15]OHA52516.1 MAG: hypothetical protein A2991_04305 [Candidatus Terrybacteria bacterium RIFCSPLOWO2_01_FULL_58_14]